MRIETRVDGRCVKEYLKSGFIIYWIGLVLGILYLVADIVFAVIDGGPHDQFGFFMVLSIFLIVFASLFLFVFYKNVKTTNEHAYDTIHVFGDDGIHVESYVKGEKKSDGKIGFDEINHFRVTKNYVFLVYYNKTFAPLVKDDKLIDFLLSKNIKKK